MDLVGAAFITIGITAVAVTAMLLVRRRAPEGSYFADGDRAAGVFGVLASGFAILLGFVVFLAFSSYDSSRSGAEAEALVVTQQVEDAQLFDDATATDLTGELACYARHVARTEWDEMEAGTIGDDFNPWAVALFRSIQQVEPASAKQEAAYAKWLDQTSAREEARRDRVHGAVGVIPSPLWVVLIAIAAVIFGFTLFFADSGERAVVQGVLMGGVVSVIVMLLLLLQFLDNPFKSGTGSLEPVAMERTLRQIDKARDVLGEDTPPPCDDRGVEVGGSR